MTTFDLDREVREAAEKRWGKELLSDAEKMEKIIELFENLPLPERKKMFQRLKREIKKLPFSDADFSQLPY